jgi:hypothetical protein
MIDIFDGYDRSKAIEALIRDDIDSIIVSYSDFGDTFGDTCYIDSILRSGHKGYENMTDEEIIEELEGRDISYLFGDDDDDYDGQPDEAQEWHDFDPEC